MSEIDVSKCPAYHLYSVFGIDDKGCCYLEHKYCDEVVICEFKYLQQQLHKLKQENKKLKEIKTISNIYKGIKEMDEIIRIINRRK